METLNAASNAALREAIYTGKVIRMPSSPLSRRLVSEVWAAIEAEFGTTIPRRELQFKLPGDELYARIGKVRKRLAGEAQYQKLLYELLSEQGFVKGEHAVDPVLASDDVTGAISDFLFHVRSRARPPGCLPRPASRVSTGRLARDLAT